MDRFRNSLDDRREELVDFADRYERGAPYEGISEEDVVRRYREVLSKLPGEDYRHSAHKALSRMKPEEHAELGTQLRDQSMQQGYDFPVPSVDDGEATSGTRSPHGVDGPDTSRASGLVGGVEQRRRCRFCGRYDGRRDNRRRGRRERRRHARNPRSKRRLRPA